MAGLELVVLIGATVLVGGKLARVSRLSSPLVLLVLGAGLGFIPGLGEIQLPPDLVLLLFLPALVYWEALNNTSLREIRFNLRAILFAAIGLVLLTAFCIGAAGSAFGLPWPAALALGAVLAPTDATAISGFSGSLPRRSAAILRAESLVNDGTALALYGVAVAAVVSGGRVSVPLFAGQFLLASAIAVAVGLGIGFLVLWVRRIVTDSLLASTLSLLTPFLAFLPAELLHASGVVAAVTCGLVIAHGGPRVIPARARRQVFGFWQVASFVLNDALFVLTGLQLHRIVNALDGASWPTVLALSAVAVLAVIGLRLLWFYTVPYLARPFERTPALRTRRIAARHRFPLAWAGMRGSVSLAAALALPLTIATGAAFSHRDTLIAVTFAVILFTVVVQGLTMPAVLRWTALPPDPTQAYEEALATRTAFESALAVLPDIAAELGVAEEIRDRITAEYALEADELGSLMNDDDLSVTELDDARSEQERELRRAVIPVKRDSVLRLRDAGRIDDVVLRRIQARLDAEEIRLTDVIDEE
ncbi:MAG TPA: Na+/H+ antiporter [Gryllotalpicola sp.]